MAGTYWIGVLLAILAGIVANLGLLMQKKVVNEKSDEEKFFKALVKNPVWLVGTILNLIVGSIILSWTARFQIGPTLIPGLASAGLIVLAVGSVKLINEKLRALEYAGIVSIIAAILFLGLSGMLIEVENFDFLDEGFLVRFSIATVIIGVAIVGLYFYQRKAKRGKALAWALISGFFLTLAETWVTGVLWSFDRVFEFEQTPVAGDFFYMIVGSIVVFGADMLAVISLQRAFKRAQASNLVPIQQVPLQLSPILMFLFMFNLAPPAPSSIPLMVVGVLLILGGFVILARRQVLVEEIK